MIATIHIGEIIKKSMKDQGRSAAWLAEKLSYNRTNVYKIYLKSNIDADLLMKISILLQVDFFVYYSEYFKSKSLSNFQK